MHLLAIFLGGGLGSLARYGLTIGIQHFGLSTLPLGTIFSNIVASFILGYLSMYTAEGWPTAVRLGWMVGFCGGFSTFSTFTAENFHLLEAGNFGHLGLNILVSITFCLIFFFLGYKLAA